MRQLRALGYTVAHDASWSQPRFRKLSANPPAAVVIDLSRTRSRGRDVAAMFRSRSSMLQVPIIGVGGDREAIARMKTVAPDAFPANWGNIGSAIGRGIANPPSAKRQSVFAAYAAVPLWKKLGIKERSVVATLNSPDGLEKTLGQLPKGARLTRGSRGERDLTLWFVRKPAELQRKIASLTQFAERGGLWIIWQKGGSAGSLTQASVRETGLAHGLVDFRVSSIDVTWSGLRFTLRK